MQTPAQTPDWEKYRSAYIEHEAMLAYMRQMSNQLVGITTAEKHLQYAEQILVKMLAHCITFSQLLPNPNGHKDFLWDLSSISAIARSIIETHDAIAYIAFEKVTAEERQFRILLWEFHDTSRRLKMLKCLGSQDPKYYEMEIGLQNQKLRVTSDPSFIHLNGNVQKKIKEDDPPPFHLSQRDRCLANRINFDYYNFSTMQLSQHVHTLPFSIHQLFSFRAGSQEAINLMIMPIQFALPFVARVIEGIQLLFPGKCQPPDASVHVSIQIWSQILESGLKKTSQEPTSPP